MYTINEVTINIIKLAETIPSLKVDYLSRKQIYRIKFKEGNRYKSGWECFNQIKFIYETMNLQKINWDYFLYQVFDKHIEIRSTYKIV